MTYDPDKIKVTEYAQYQADLSHLDLSFSSLATEEGERYFKSEFGSALMDYMILGDPLRKAWALDQRTRQTFDALVEQGRLVDYEIHPAAQRCGFRISKRGFVVFKYRKIVKNLEGGFDDVYFENPEPAATRDQGPHRPLRKVRKWAWSKLGEVVQQITVQPVKPAEVINVKIDSVEFGNGKTPV